MGNTKKKKYSSEHTLFTFHPADSSDYEIWDDMGIAKRLDKYTSWFIKNEFSAKKYNFKKYVNPEGFSSGDINDPKGRVTVQIFDKKIDTLFRLTWI